MATPAAAVRARDAREGGSGGVLASAKAPQEVVARRDASRDARWDRKAACVEAKAGQFESPLPHGCCRPSLPTAQGRCGPSIGRLRSNPPTSPLPSGKALM
eukprot:3024168-Prymnesium_polylepis.1